MNSFLSVYLKMVTSDFIKQVGFVLNSSKYPLKQRFRALFTLKNLGGTHALDEIIKCFSDKSALLKHELAYCLGQMNQPYAVTKLLDVLQDDNENVVVRHEAAEALGAIADMNTFHILVKYKESPIEEIAETCTLAVERMECINRGEIISSNIYNTIDPVPPYFENNIDNLKKIYLSDHESICNRYKALFSLRDLNTDQSVEIITRGLNRGSVLFRHEVAFVLGQLQSPLSVPALITTVKNQNENEIVRHESIEALGAIGTEECINVIQQYINDENDLIRESCEVALDMSDYTNSVEFQYANGLENIS